MTKADPVLTWMPNTEMWCEYKRKSRPVCLGSGLVVLDVIYDGKSKDPVFFAGGSCCNVLTILAYLGWDSFPLARLGRDPEGDRIVEDMKRWGVSTKFVERNPEIHSPRIIQRIHDGDTPRHRFHLKCEHGFWLPRRRALSLTYLQSIRDTLPWPNIFYFDRADPATLRAAAAFKEQGSIIMFEPPRTLGSNVFVHCLELADIVKYCSRSHQAERLEVDAPLEIQTRGAEGLRYRARFLGNPDWVEMKAIPAPRLVDAVGSGDWLTAGLVHALQYNDQRLPSSEKELQRSLRFGQTLASINCGFIGARGVMYSLDRRQLFSVSDRVASGNEIPSTLFTKPEIKASALSTGCRTCVCIDSISQ